MFPYARTRSNGRRPLWVERATVVDLAGPSWSYSSGTSPIRNSARSAVIALPDCARSWLT